MQQWVPVFSAASPLTIYKQTEKILELPKPRENEFNSYLVNSNAGANTPHVRFLA